MKNVRVKFIKSHLIIFFMLRKYMIKDRHVFKKRSPDLSLSFMEIECYLKLRNKTLDFMN